MKQTVAIIGCGSIGSRHARLLRQTPELQVLCDCVVLQDQDEMAARHLAADVGACWVTIPEQAIQLADAVLICTWPDSHLALARKSIEAGKPTFIEKPLALSLEGVEELVTLAESRQVKTMVACNWRFHPDLCEQAHPQGPKVVRLHIRNSGHNGPAMRLDLGSHALDLARFFNNPNATLDISWVESADAERREIEWADGRITPMIPTDDMYVGQLLHFLTPQRNLSFPAQQIVNMNSLREASMTLRALLERAA